MKEHPRPGMRTQRRRSRVWMLTTGALSFAVSVIVIFSLPRYTPAVDSADYEHIAQSIAGGQGIGTTMIDPRTRRAVVIPDVLRPPLYPIVISPAYMLAGRTLARLLTAAIGAVAVMLLFVLVGDLWGTRAGLCAALLASVYPPLVITNVALLTEPLFLVFQLALMIGLVRFGRNPGGYAWPVALGVMVGLESLTRGNGLLFLPLAMFGVWSASSGPPRSRTAQTIAVLGATALTLAPWAIRNAERFGHFVPTTDEAGYTLITVLNGRSRHEGGEADIRVWPPEIASAAGKSEELLVRHPFELTRLNGPAIGNKLMARALRYAWSHPGYAVKAGVLNVLRSLNLISGWYTSFRAYAGVGVPDAGIWRSLVPVSYLLYVLALAGAVVLTVTRSLARPPIVFWLIPATALLSSGWVGGALRYSVPLDPLLLALAALALTFCAPRLVRRLPGALPLLEGRG